MSKPPAKKDLPVKQVTPQVTLYSNHLTPNGLKVSIYLEELKIVDPTFNYNLERVNTAEGEHKAPSFLKMNPNGRIPILVDHNQDDFAIFESAAILLYLEQHYDKKKCLSPDPQKSPKDYSTMLQWIFFAHGGVGPMQGQAHFFLHFSPEDVPFGKKRYCDETKRLYGVLDTALTGRDWLVGSYSIADMNVLPWIRIHERVNIENLDEWPNLKLWLSRALQRPGVQAAIKSAAL